jgi:hypothetical protein
MRRALVRRAGAVVRVGGAEVNARKLLSQALWLVSV